MRELRFYPRELTALPSLRKDYNYSITQSFSFAIHVFARKEFTKSKISIHERSKRSFHFPLRNKKILKIPLPRILRTQIHSLARFHLNCRKRQLTATFRYSNVSRILRTRGKRIGAKWFHTRSVLPVFQPRTDSLKAVNATTCLRYLLFYPLFLLLSTFFTINKETFSW